VTLYQPEKDELESSAPEAFANTLREARIERIEAKHEATSGNAGLECATRCTARCCPQAMASRDPAYQVGHVAIMMPFELEYLSSRTNVDASTLQRGRSKSQLDYA